MNNETDCCLARRAKDGDTDAFGELVRRHQSAVFNVAYRILGNRGDAEDAAQEAFIRAYQAIDSFDTARPLLPWLKTITVNGCLNRIKRDHPSTSLEEFQSAPKEPNPGPEAQTARRERETQIRAAILALPPDYRAVIELRHFQNLSYIEIGKALDRPLSDVKSNLFRARKMLAEKLKDVITL